MEDEDFSSNMTRDDFEKMCEPMMAKVKAVLDGAIAMAVTKAVTVEQIESIEIIGGASRVPWFKKMCSEAFGGKDLSTTMNADEAVARGCALQAAILSPLYKVRDFQVEDTSPFPINVGWMGSSADAEAAKTEEDGDTQMAGGEGEYKTATLFPAGSSMNLLKMLTFYRKGPFDVKAEYPADTTLLPMTSSDLGSYKIELPPQTEAKKIKVKAKLTLSGIFAVEGAQLVEEEEYEETVKEKRELPAEEVAAEAPAEAEVKPDGDAPMPEAGKEGEAGEEKKEGEAAPEVKVEEQKKEPEKKYEWVDVKKTKKRTKRTDLTVTSSGKPGLSSAVLQKRMDEETAMQVEMQEIIDTDEKKNDLEGYIFNMRDKIGGGEYSAFIAEADKEKFMAELTKSEDWVYDTYDATKAQFIEKLDELKSLGDVVVWRFKEDSMRKEWIDAVSGTVNNYRNAAENPGDKYGHIAPEKLQKITAACNELDKWLTEMKTKQDAMPKTEKPVLICADMEKKNQELAKTADEILKEPKPAPPKEEKPAEEKPADAPAADAPAAEGAAPADAPADGPQNMDVD
jgi:molecular chaperone DnaK (HSP70)